MYWILKSLINRSYLLLQEIKKERKKKKKKKLIISVQKLNDIDILNIYCSLGSFSSFFDLSPPVLIVNLFKFVVETLINALLGE